MTDQEFTIYAAAFLDGEGSITLARQRANGRSDYHMIRIVVSQRAKHREVLDRFVVLFGGRVGIRSQKNRLSEQWAEQAEWILQDKPHILSFLLAIQPYCIVKARQVAVALEFLETFVAGKSFRDSLGRIHGEILTADEIERRERLRLEMRALNQVGPPKVKPSALPPLDVQHRRRTEEERVADISTVKRGTAHHQAHFTEDDIRAIRATYAAGGASKSDLARQYGVTFMAITKIVRGDSWKHVT